jgi:hypothetical protein
MPPAKRFSHSLKVGLTEFEYFLLERLQQVTGQSMADQIRQAIMVYAAQLKELPASAVRLAAFSKGQSKKSAPEDVRLFQQQAETFERMKAAQDSAPRAGGDTEEPTWSSNVAPIKPVKSSADTFPTEDE